MYDRMIDRVAAAIVLGCVLLAAQQAMALPQPAGDDPRDEVVVRKVVAVNAGEKCEQSDEHCKDFVWMMEEDGAEIDVHVMPFEIHGRGGYLGVEYLPIGVELLEHFDVDAESGVLVSRVVDNSPASRADIRVGDVITAIDGRNLEHSHEFGVSIARREKGDTVELELWRNASSFSVTAVIETRERPRFDFSQMLVPGPDADRFLFRVDPERLKDAQRKLELVLEDSDLREHIKGITVDEQQLQERMKQLEEQLRRLEQQLQEALAAVEIDAPAN